MPSQIKPTVEVEMDAEDKKDVKTTRGILPTKSTKDKKARTSLEPDSASPDDKVKTLRGIFRRLGGKKVEPVIVSPVKSSVLKKLSKN